MSITSLARAAMRILVSDLSPHASFGLAEWLFKRRFPAGGLSREDLRDHYRKFGKPFDGYGVNAHASILPGASEQETREAALALLSKVARWLRRHRCFFGPKDRIQLVIHFPFHVKQARTQVFKCWLPACGLGALRGTDFDSVGGLFREMPNWTAGLEWPYDGRMRFSSKPDKCPSCHSVKIAEILYGLLMMSETLRRELDSGEVVQGGCIIYPDAPMWRCRRCKRLFYKFRKITLCNDV